MVMTTDLNTRLQQALGAVGCQSIQQIALVLTAPNARAAFLDRALFVTVDMLFGAVCAEEASVWTRLTVGSDGEALATDFTIS